MHVADVTMFYAPRSGGVRRYIEAKRTWLNAHAGYSHSLVVPAPRLASLEPGIVSLPSVPLPLSHGYRMPLGKSSAIRSLLHLRPTVIEAGDPYPLAWAVLDAGQQLGVPVVAFCHSDLPRLIGLRYGARAERLAERYCGHLYRHFDLVLAPSAAMTARVRGWGVAQARHQPLGVDLAVFDPLRRDPGMRARLGLSPRDRVLAYAGRFAPEKNLGVLVRAMRRLGSGYVALLIGAGKPPADLPDNVRVVSYLADRTALASLLASCDAFVHPGDQETFGLAALEAMACGLPVVGVDAAGMAELVTRDAGVLVPPRDADALAQAIVALFEQAPGPRGVQARRHAEAYGWQRVLPQLVARYTALGACRSASTPLAEDRRTADSFSARKTPTG